MSEAELTDTEQAGPTVQLSVVTTATDGIRVLTLVGEIDHHTGDTLRHALDASDTSRPRIVVDMRQVTFMDSSGINILLVAHRALSEAGGWLRLAAIGDSVMRTISLVGVAAAWPLPVPGRPPAAPAGDERTAAGAGEASAVPAAPPFSGMTRLTFTAAVAAVLSSAVAVPQASAGTPEQPPTVSVQADFNSCGYEVTDAIRLRTGLGTRYTALGLLHRGVAVYASQARGGWYRVRLAYDSGSASGTRKSSGLREGTTGWVVKRALRGERLHADRLTECSREHGALRSRRVVAPPRHRGTETSGQSGTNRSTRSVMHGSTSDHAIRHGVPTELKIRDA
ncbi:hypothetical protein GCM10018980_18780 [Streptomyces capoamus]|uniref:Anti-sigma factor antagonist n=1 Tax=Streptomyces capoamus TaxID=68183 RepID=A0A919EW17_9ACTN|nr:STAS domain-containing protein [Streptomyces capoamus]GGW16373.1 hypothetical protein GCM10010501_32380 [Streptomyces libani subsp. rufus]GHG42679.1 hypothetical protein GCM10018980_18780 [Streptomyces capoamus]